MFYNDTNMLNFTIEEIINLGEKQYSIINTDEHSIVGTLSRTRTLMLEEFTNLYIEKNNVLPVPYYNKYYTGKENKITYKKEQIFIRPSGIIWKDEQYKYGWAFQFITGDTECIGFTITNWKKIKIGDIDIIIEIGHNGNSDLIQDLEIANFVFSILSYKIIKYIENEGKDKFNKLVKFQKLTEEGVEYNKIIQSIED